MLADRFSKEFLKTHLLPCQDWRPFPTAADRLAWQDLLKYPLNKKRKKEIIRQAERALGAAWPALPATLYMEFIRNGNRDNFEVPYFERRGRLAVLALAECLEYQGRFLDEIINGLWYIMEETTWCLPAHAERHTDKENRPDVLSRLDRQTADLFACETALILAETRYLLKNELDRTSPIICQRLEREVLRRVVEPMAQRDDFWWFSGRNNWTPWCSANTLGAALYLLDDQEQLVDLTHKLMQAVDRFIATYGPDGGCSEGASYWGVAAGMMLIFLEFLYDRSQGAISIYHEPLIKNMGEYILKAHLDGPWFANFADCPPMVVPNRSFTYRYGERVNSPEMMDLAQWSMRGWQKAGAIRPVIQQRFSGGDIGFILRELFWIPADAHPQPLKYHRDAWLPDLQVMAARETEQQGRGLVLAAKAGHNDECHNHNDVGQFIILLDGRPAIIDVGVGTYTRFTFSEKRYTIWCIGAQGHNVPQVNGCFQQAGKEFRAVDVRYNADQNKVSFCMDLTKAYPATAGLASLERKIVFKREGQAAIIITDRFMARGNHLSMALPLYTPGRPRQRKTGVWEVPAGKNVLVLEFDPSFFKCSVQNIHLDDRALSQVWGKVLYKLMLTSKKRHSQGEYQLRFFAKR
jgi:hypothetical protein